MGKLQDLETGRLMEILSHAALAACGSFLVGPAADAHSPPPSCSSREGGCRQSSCHVLKVSGKPPPFLRAPPELGGRESDARIPLPITKRQCPGSPPASAGRRRERGRYRGRGRLNLLWLLRQPRRRARGGSRRKAGRGRERDGGGGVERRGARPRPAAARGRAPRATAGPARRLAVLSLPLPHR
jgi:hypothetical protein